MEQIMANMGTIIVLIVLAAIVGGIIFFKVRDRKNGKCSCGGSCGCCPMGDKCHGGKN